MNIRIYSEERKETNINEYEYIRLKIFEYIRMSEYSLHTAATGNQVIYCVSVASVHILKEDFIFL